VTRLRVGRPGLDSRLGQEFHLFATAFRSDLGPTQPPTYLTYLHTYPLYIIKENGKV